MSRVAEYGTAERRAQDRALIEDPVAVADGPPAAQRVVAASDLTNP